LIVFRFHFCNLFGEYTAFVRRPTCSCICESDKTFYNTKTVANMTFAANDQIKI